MNCDRLRDPGETRARAQRVRAVPHLVHSALNPHGVNLGFDDLEDTTPSAWAVRGARCAQRGVGVRRSTKYLVMSLTAGDAYLEVSPKLEVREVAMRGGGGGVLVHLPRGSCSRQSRPQDRQGSGSCRRVCAS